MKVARRRGLTAERVAAVAIGLAALCMPAMVLITTIWVSAQQPAESLSSWNRQLAGWGSDRVDGSMPDYMTGDECLFCHRNIGASWSNNPHQRTMRIADPRQEEIQALASCDPAIAQEVDFLLGADRSVKYLKRSESYGRLDLLTASYQNSKRLADQPQSDRGEPGSGCGQLVFDDSIGWNDTLFGSRCIGCHTTAVDSQQQTFASTSLDCFTCHGEVDLEHATDISKVLLSRHPQNPLVVNSICSSCHLRGGKSRSSGLPFPNTFVPGDNLFRDFHVDLSNSAIAKLPAMQQHIYLSARAVGSGSGAGGNGAVGGGASQAAAGDPVCTDCHSVHGNHTRQHMELADSTICYSCHVPGSEDRELVEAIRQYDRTSTRNVICDY